MTKSPWGNPEDDKARLRMERRDENRRSARDVWSRTSDRPQGQASRQAEDDDAADQDLVQKTKDQWRRDRDDMRAQWRGEQYNRGSGNRQDYDAAETQFEADYHRAHDQDYQGRSTTIGPFTRLVLFLVGLCLLMLSLSFLFPQSELSDPYLIRSLLILGIFGGAAAFWSRSSIARLFKMAGVWMVFVFGASAFYLYQSELGDRFMSALTPSSPVATAEGLVFHRAEDGHFWIDVEFNGETLTMLMDTGATSIVLSPADARRIGVNMNQLDFRGKARTANGIVRFAVTTIDQVRVGDRYFYDLKVHVNEADMQGSLLGMAMLDQFSGFEISGNRLTLKP